MDHPNNICSICGRMRHQHGMELHNFRILTAVEGLDPEQPTVTNSSGGKQSDTPYGLRYVPALAILAESKVLKRGAEKYGEKNWEKIPIEDHLNHALQHIYAFLAGDRSDNHLANLSCRSHFALDLEEQNKSKLPKYAICVDCKRSIGMGEDHFSAGDGFRLIRCFNCHETLAKNKRILDEAKEYIDKSLEESF